MTHLGLYLNKKFIEFKTNHPVPVEGSTRPSRAAAGSEERSCSEAKDLGKAGRHSTGEIQEDGHKYRWAEDKDIYSLIV